MAPAFLGFSSSPLPHSAGNNKSVAVPPEKNKGSEVEMLRSKNVQLQRLVEESQRYETELLAELEETRIRLFKTEEAEERLCSELGELEAESVHQARAYNEQVRSLKQQLAQSQSLLAAAQEQLKCRNR